MRLCDTITISQLFSEHSSFRMSLSCHYRKCIHDYHQEVLIFRVTFLSSSRNTERQSLGKTLLISRCLTSRFCKNNEERVQKIEFWQAVSRFSMVNQLNRQRFSTYHHSLNGNILGTSKLNVYFPGKTQLKYVRSRFTIREVETSCTKTAVDIAL